MKQAATTSEDHWRSARRAEARVKSYSRDQLLLVTIHANREVTDDEVARLFDEALKPRPSWGAFQRMLAASSNEVNFGRAPTQVCVSLKEMPAIEPQLDLLGFRFDSRPRRERRPETCPSTDLVAT